MAARHQSRHQWSITRRLSWRLLLATLAATVFTGVIVAVHYGRDTDDLSQRKLLELAETLSSRGGPDAETDAGAAIAAAPSADIFKDYPQAYRWGVYSARGELLAASDGGPPAAAVDLAWPPPAAWTAPSGAVGWAAGVALGPDDALGSGGAAHLVVEALDDPAGLLLRLVAGEVLVHVVLPLAPFALLVSVLGFSVTRRTLRPVREAARQARSIKPREALSRIDVSDAPAEIEDLVTALNDALDRIHAAAEREREFVLDAAHALRTPLAALKARLEVQDGPQSVQGFAEEIDEVTRLATQLLASAAAERLVVEPGARVDLATLARDIAADMTPLFLAQGVDLEVEAQGAVIVVADRDAIAHALRNLLDNAVKANAGEGAVRIMVAADRRVCVHDQGPGVAPERHGEIVRRFSRRSYGDGRGAGLGLSIVSRIMHAHGGRLEIGKAPGGGAAFSLVFPQAKTT